MEFNNDDLIVYTSLIGENEGLNSQPFFNSSNLRHVCLTDDENLTSDDWEIRLVDRIIPQDSYRSQRHFKIRPHIIFPNYKYSLYLDNTVVLRKRTEELIKMILNSQCHLLTFLLNIYYYLIGMRKTLLPKAPKH